MGGPKQAGDAEVRSRALATARWSPGTRGHLEQFNTTQVVRPTWPDHTIFAHILPTDFGRSWQWWHPPYWPRANLAGCSDLEVTNKRAGMVASMARTPCKLRRRCFLYRRRANKAAALAASKPSQSRTRRFFPAAVSAWLQR